MLYFNQGDFLPHLIHNIFNKLISILQLTDFRGEPYPYDKDATWPDEYGVLVVHFVLHMGSETFVLHIVLQIGTEIGWQMKNSTSCQRCSTHT